MQLLLSLPKKAAKRLDSNTQILGFDVKASHDPPEKRLGSGGGTAWLLSEAYQDSKETSSFEQWIGKNKKVLVEFSSPNIGKPFGIGQLRSTIIGNSISKIYDFMGFKPVRLNYLGDWGTQFGKLILGYQEFGDEKKLKEKPIEHLLELYVKISKDEKYDEQAREWFKKLEDGNKEAVMLWENFRRLSLEEFKKI